MLFSMTCLLHQKMVYYHLVIFHLLLPSLHLLCGMFLMSMISVSCSFVIISFHSFYNCSCVFFHAHKATNTILLLWNLCITNFYIFCTLFRVSACH